MGPIKWPQRCGLYEGRKEGATYRDGLFPSRLLVGECRGKFTGSLEPCLGQRHVLFQPLLLSHAIVVRLLQSSYLLFHRSQSLLLLSEIVHHHLQLFLCRVQPTCTARQGHGRLRTSTPSKEIRDNRLCPCWPMSAASPSDSSLPLQAPSGPTPTASTTNRTIVDNSLLVRVPRPDFGPYPALLTSGDLIIELICI